MYRRDYIIRLVEQIAQMVAQVRGRIESRQFDEAGEGLDQAFRELLGRGAEAAELSETELLARLTQDGPTQLVKEKTLLLVALLQEAARLHGANGRETQSHECRLKALNLLLTLQLEEPELQLPEFVPKTIILHDQLREVALPLRTLAGLWRYYEHLGDFGRAEDALFSLREAEPENAELRAEARAFYERLLRLGDDSLAQGNLPRSEVRAGLAELGK